MPNYIAGFITLREAITRLAVRCAPAAGVRAYLQPPYPGRASEISGIHPTQWERAPELDPFLRPLATGLRVEAWEALQDARNPLHDALSGGRLTVFVRDAANSLQPVPAPDWHTEYGHDLIATGMAGGYPVKDDPVFIQEAAFAEWLWKRLPAGSAPGAIVALPDPMMLMQAAAWLMLREASAASTVSGHAELTRAWTTAGPGPDFEGALAALLERLRDCRLPSFARTAAGDTQLTARQWRTMMPALCGADLAAFEAKPEGYRGRPLVALLTVSRAELFELWPAMPGAPTATKRPEQTLPPSYAAQDEPVLTPQPFPQAELIAPWVAASWRAFATLNAPSHICRHRSFDGGGQRLPDEGSGAYAKRQDEHHRFDDAERKVLGLLAAGHIRATGKPPARSQAGELLHEAAPVPDEIPAVLFRNKDLAFTAGSELIFRKHSLERLAPSYELRGSNADPRFPLYHDVLIEAVGLRQLWNNKVETSNQPAEILSWLTDAAETFLREKKSKPKRDNLVQDCVAALKCRYEDAEAAYKMLPIHLRRVRGERG